MKSGRSLAAAQTVPVPGDVGANIEQHEQLARQAAEAGARVLVFPELSLTGYELEIAREMAFVEDDPRLGPLVGIATRSGVTVIAGAPVRIGSALHIGAFIVAPAGRPVLYTKRHLGGREDRFVVPGGRDPLVSLGSRHAAVAICADANRPAHAHAAVERGVAAYLVGAFIEPAGIADKHARLRGYAADHAMVVAFSNYGGRSGGLDSGGASAIWSGDGELLGRLPPSGAGVVVAIEQADGWRGETRLA